jgi:myo-inositol-1(or 4)-monophosphatase
MDGAELRAALRAAETAADAGARVLAGLRPQPGRRSAQLKGRRELVTQADREMERAIVESLERAFPGHAILAEEGVLSPAGAPDKSSDYVWIVDPLDGTTNFVHDLPFYCIALALAERGEIVAGSVLAPRLGERFSAVRGGGATRNGAPLRVSSTGALADALLATGFSYNRNEPGRDDNLARLGRVLPRCRDLRRYGSAQLDLCYVAAGVYDGYWEMYLAPYDVAAGALIVREAGGRVSDLTGGAQWLRGGQILASNGVLHDELLALVGGAPG